MYIISHKRNFGFGFLEQFGAKKYFGCKKIDPDIIKASMASKK